MASSSAPADPRVEKVARIIARFNWYDFGLDDVGEIGWPQADYARALAGRIVQALDRAAQVPQ